MVCVQACLKPKATCNSITTALATLTSPIQIYGRHSLGEENRIDEVRTDGFNKVIVCGDSFSKTDPQRGGYLGYVRIKNYEKKGLVLRNVDGMSLRGGWTSDMSSIAVVGDPGCNGILLDAAANIPCLGLAD